MTPRTWTNGSGTPLSADNLNALEADVAGKAPASHTHAAADVTSGTFAAARLPAATGSAAGSMSAADKTKLDAATDLDTVDTIVKRSTGGWINAFNVAVTGQPTQGAHLTNKSYVDTETAKRALTAHSHAVATTSADGFMAAADKTKLDGLSGDNLIGDGGFNTGMSAVLNTYNGTTTRIVDALKSRSGNAFIELAQTTTTADAQTLFTGFPVHEGRTYRITAWARTGTGANGLAKFAGTLTKPDGVASFIANQSSFNMVSTAWTELSMTYTIPAGSGYGDFSVRVLMVENRVVGNSLRIDDVYAVDITEVIRVARSTETLATASLNGFMPAADKAKLDAATAATSNGTVVMRDANGNSGFDRVLVTDPPSGADHATRKDYVDAMSQKAYRAYTMADAPTVYGPGVTTFLAASTDGWNWGNGQTFANVVTAKSTFDGGTTQWAYPYTSETLPPLMRYWKQNATAWGPWRTMSTVENHGTVSVKDYGAVGDGVTNDTTAINAALAATQGKRLYWPAGKYIVTSNLTDFWNVFHTGFGSIARGADEFFITPVNSSTLVQTSTLWADGTSGLDTNDGLFSTSKVKTLSKLYFQMLRRLTPEQANGGKWVVRMSGTFTGGQKLADLPEFAFGLTFEGDPLVSGNPVTVVNYNAVSNIGMWFEPGIRQVFVNKIKFTGFKVGFNGYGVLMKDGGTLTVNDCWADNCDIGFAAIGNVAFQFKNTRSTNCSDGFRGQYSASGTFDNCTADICSSNGFFISRNAVAHIDYCTISNNAQGIYVDNAARVNLMGSNVKKNTLGIKAEGSGEWINTLSPANNFFAGTVDANTRDYQSFGVGRETRQYSQGTHNEWMISSAMEAVSSYETPVTVTGTTSNTTVYLGSAIGELPANWFTHTGKKLRCKVFGKATTTTTAAKVRLYVTEIDGSAITMLTEISIPNGANNTPFEIDFNVWAKATASQLTRGSLVGSGISTAAAGTATLNMATGKRFRLYCLPGATTDSFTFDNMEMYFSG